MTSKVVLHKANHLCFRNVLFFNHCLLYNFTTFDKRTLMPKLGSGTRSCENDIRSKIDEHVCTHAPVLVRNMTGWLPRH